MQKLRLDTMDRIKADGTINIDGKRMFTDGDQEAEDATKGTVVNAQFLNAVQEELCNAITSEGLTLQKDNFSQLREAMTLNTYRMKIVSHLFTMVETLHQVSSEIHIPRVTFNADIIGTIRNINDAITHISSEAKIPDVPENTTEIDIVEIGRAHV